MQIPKNATTKDLTIQGLTFQVPVVVTANEFTDSIEPICNAQMAANILQQTFMENWRNNFAKSVTKAVIDAAKAKGFEGSKVSEIDDDLAQAIFDELSDSDTHAELQASLDEYIAGYEPGIRRTGGGESLSPIDREAKRIATDLVREHLERTYGIGRTARSESYKEWEKKLQEETGQSGAEYIAEMAEQLVENNPEIRATAQKNIESRLALSSGISLSFSQ